MYFLHILIALRQKGGDGLYFMYLSYMTRNRINSSCIFVEKLITHMAQYHYNQDRAISSYNKPYNQGNVIQVSNQL